MGLDQLRDVIAAGLRPAWVVFDEEYGRPRAFWLGLNDMGQIGVGEVPKDFRCWVKRPACTSVQTCHAARRVDNLGVHSPVFYEQSWKRCIAKETTRGECVWEYKSARVQLPDADGPASAPGDRMYWLIVMRQPESGEMKYVLSNAAEGVTPEQLIRVLLSRWHVEKWFERAKQEVGLGAFEVRTYTSLIRHWLCAALSMCFLAEQTTRLVGGRGEKSTDHVRAGRGGGEHDLREDMAERFAFVG